MPSLSKAQRRVMALAEHHPEELYNKNNGLLDMSKGQLHDFASTPEKGLPYKKKSKVTLKKPKTIKVKKRRRLRG